jgi:hypothetical protein
MDVKEKVMVIPDSEADPAKVQKQTGEELPQ